MAILARMARHLLELVEVTEADACRKYEEHVAKCPKCQPAKGRACRTGLRLHGQWKAAEAAQPAGRT